MINYISQAIRLTLLTILACIVLYPSIVLVVAKVAPAGGRGERIVHGGRTVGYALVGQSFTGTGYFHGRPSAVAYNAAGSGGSNKGPADPDHLRDVRSRVDSFMAHHPGVQPADIPSDLVTASGSGLDPDISMAAARVQAASIAAVRGMPLERVLAVIDAHRSAPASGLLGTEHVNVLALNLALDEVKK